jgi:hypothetical protein
VVSLRQSKGTRKSERKNFKFSIDNQIKIWYH